MPASVWIKLIPCLLVLIACAPADLVEEGEDTSQSSTTTAQATTTGPGPQGGGGGASTSGTGGAGVGANGGMGGEAGGGAGGVTSTQLHVTSGDRFSCDVNTQGALRCWGLNDYGQLGDGTMVSSASPQTIPGQWKRVSAGEHHTCSIRFDGTLWCWGRSISNGSAQDESSPTLVDNGSWETVASGDSHSCAIRAGTMWCWGYNDYKQLGSETKDTKQLLPLQVGIDNKWVQLEAGDHHTCAIRSDATLWCWGSNNDGALGLGYLETALAPKQVPGNWLAVGAGPIHTCAIKTDGSMWCWGDGNALGKYYMYKVQYEPVPVGGVKDYKSVSAGGSHSCATRADNSLRCWGPKIESFLAGTSLMPSQVGTGWMLISVGSRYGTSLAHFCGSKTDGSTWCWGHNAEGQLGIGTMSGDFTATAQPTL